MKTIKQIADEIGVSKTAVRKRLTPDIQSRFTETISGTIHISPDGERLIKQAFKNTPQNIPQTTHPEFTVEHVPALISLLQAQQQTITSLTTTNRELAAALHAETMRQIADGVRDGKQPVKKEPAPASRWRVIADALFRRGKRL